MWYIEPVRINSEPFLPQLNFFQKWAWSIHNMSRNWVFWVRSNNSLKWRSLDLIQRWLVVRIWIICLNKSFSWVWVWTRKKLDMSKKFFFDFIFLWLMLIDILFQKVLFALKMRTARFFTCLRRFEILHINSIFIKIKPRLHIWHSWLLQLPDEYTVTCHKLIKKEWLPWHFCCKNLKRAFQVNFEAYFCPIAWAELWFRP